MTVKFELCFIFIPEFTDNVCSFGFGISDCSLYLDYSL